MAMFRRTKRDGEDDGPDAAQTADMVAPRPAPRAPLPPVGGSLPGARAPLPNPRQADAANAPAGASGGRPLDNSRRTSEMTGMNPSPLAPPNRGPLSAPPSAPRPEPAAEQRRFIVGPGVTLKGGEISSCDRLIVEGSIEADLKQCRDIDIADAGLFKGAASIEDAEIRGRFEGTLTVRKRLLIRATGKVVGTIRYGQIEIECGGQISGDVQASEQAGAPSQPPLLGQASGTAHDSNATTELPPPRSTRSLGRDQPETV